MKLGHGGWVVLWIAVWAPASAQNLLENPDFAADLSGWTPFFSGNGSVTWDALDAAGSASSGSARLTTPSGEGQTVVGIDQCVPVDDSEAYMLAASVFRPEGEDLSVFGNLVWWADGECNDFLDTTTPISLFPPGSGEWEAISGSSVPIPGAHSVIVRMRGRREGDGAQIAHVDDIVFAVEQGCIGDANTLCLNDGRFRVTTEFRTPQDETGSGTAVGLTDDTGYFWFFNDENVELVVKVLNGCATPFNSFWVFAAGLTNVEVTLQVEDTEAEEMMAYVNPLDRPFEPIQDTAAFLTCP